MKNKLFRGMEFIFDHVDVSGNWKTYLANFINETLSDIYGDNKLGKVKENIKANKSLVLKVISSYWLCKWFILIIMFMIIISLSWQKFYQPYIQPALMSIIMSWETVHISIKNGVTTSCSIQDVRMNWLLKVILGEWYHICHKKN
jgi:hypothetical protein